MVDAAPGAVPSVRAAFSHLVPADLGVPARGLSELAPLLRVVLHELRASNALASGFVQLLAERHGTALDPDGAALLAGVRRSGARAEHLLDTLTVAIGGGRPRLVALSEALVRLQERWADQIEAAGIALNLLGDIPDRDIEGRCFGVAFGHLLQLAETELSGLSRPRLALSAQAMPGRLIVDLTLSAGAAAGRAPARRGMGARILDCVRRDRLAALALGRALHVLAAELSATDEEGGVARLSLAAAMDDGTGGCA